MIKHSTLKINQNDNVADNVYHSDSNISQDKNEYRIDPGLGKSYRMNTNSRGVYVGNQESIFDKVTADKG